MHFKFLVNIEWVNSNNDSHNDNNKNSRKLLYAGLKKNSHNVIYIK